VNSIIGDSESIAYKVCLCFGALQLARMAWRLVVWVPFRHLFLKSLVGLLEASMW